MPRISPDSRPLRNIRPEINDRRSVRRTLRATERTRSREWRRDAQRFGRQQRPQFSLRQRCHSDGRVPLNITIQVTNLPYVQECRNYHLPQDRRNHLNANVFIPMDHDTYLERYTRPGNARQTSRTSSRRQQRHMLTRDHLCSRNCQAQLCSCSHRELYRRRRHRSPSNDHFFRPRHYDIYSVVHSPPSRRNRRTRRQDLSRVAHRSSRHRYQRQGDASPPDCRLHHMVAQTPTSNRSVRIRQYLRRRENVSSGCRNRRREQVYSPDYRLHHTEGEGYSVFPSTSSGDHVTPDVEDIRSLRGHSILLNDSYVLPEYAQEQDTYGDLALSTENVQDLEQGSETISSDAAGNDGDEEDSYSEDESPNVFVWRHDSDIESMSSLSEDRTSNPFLDVHGNPRKGNEQDMTNSAPSQVDFAQHHVQASETVPLSLNAAEDIDLDGNPLDVTREHTSSLTGCISSLNQRSNLPNSHQSVQKQEQCISGAPSQMEVDEQKRQANEADRLSSDDEHIDDDPLNVPAEHPDCVIGCIPSLGKHNNFPDYHRPRQEKIALEQQQAQQNETVLLSLNDSDEEDSYRDDEKSDKDDEDSNNNWKDSSDGEDSDNDDKNFAFDEVVSDVVDDHLNIPRKDHDPVIGNIRSLNEHCSLSDDHHVLSDQGIQSDESSSMPLSPEYDLHQAQNEIIPRSEESHSYPAFQVEDAYIDIIAANTRVYKYRRVKPAKDCTVCSVALRENESVRRLRCLHVFHIDCIDQWLTRNTQCFLCRTPIAEELHDILSVYRAETEETPGIQRTEPATEVVQGFNTVAMSLTSFGEPDLTA